jgi:hypothetical protein
MQTPICRTLDRKSALKYKCLRGNADLLPENAEYSTEESDESEESEESEEDTTMDYETWLEKEQVKSRLRAGAHYIRAMGYMADYRRAFVSKAGYIGLGPQQMVKGDVIVAFVGADTPFVLREVHQGRYFLLGEAYLHGLQQEALKGRTPEPFELQ